LSNDISKNGNLSYDDRTDPLLLDQKGGGDINNNDIAIVSDMAVNMGDVAHADAGQVFGLGGGEDATDVLTAKLVGKAISEGSKSHSGDHDLGHDHDDHEHDQNHDHDDHSNHSDNDHTGSVIHKIV
jgi:hypothetical protein